MNYMITGGNRGLGLALCQRYDATSYSRSTGHDITINRAEIAQASLDYDVLVNNAFDWSFEDTSADFAQVKLLHDVAALWKLHRKSGHIINIGSFGSESIEAPAEGWASYNVNKAALKHHSQQWTQAFRQGQVLFRTHLITVDRLDTDLNRTRVSWTGNGVAANDVGSMIDLCLGTHPNTCIGEVVAWVNLGFKV